MQSYKDSIQSSKTFITEGKKKGNIWLVCLLWTKESQMSTDWQSLGYVVSPSKQSAAVGQAVRGTVQLHQ